MPSKINRNSRFTAIRSQAGAIALDPSPNVTPPTPDQIVDTDGCAEILLYWGATVPSGTVSITPWVLDGIASLWVTMPTITLVPSLVCSPLTVYGVSQLFLQFSLVAAAGGTDAFIHGFGRGID